MRDHNVFFVALWIGFLYYIKSFRQVLLFDADYVTRLLAQTSGWLIKDVNFVLEKNYVDLLNNKEIDENELQKHIAKYNNVVKEMKIKWIVIKN